MDEVKGKVTASGTVVSAVQVQVNLDRGGGLHDIIYETENGLAFRRDGGVGRRVLIF